MTGPVVDFDRRKRTSVLICLVFVLIVPVEALDKHEHAYGNEKNEEGPSKDLGRSKASLRHADHESMGKSSRVHSGVQSSKTNTGNSVALNRFLENVLRAQDDFKWIDQAVREANRAKYWEKSPIERVPGSTPLHDRNRNKLREKRSYDNAIFQRDYDSQNGGTGQSSLKSKMTGVLNNVPKDWTKTEDICSLSEWMNSKELEEEKPRDRWIRDYEVDPKNHLLAKGLKDRSKQQRESSPSLESLKESLLQLKKSLREPDKKVHDTASNVDVEEDADEEKVRGKKKHEMKQNDDDDDEDSESSGLSSDPKKRERASPGDLGDKNGRKVWRTKRTDVNNDDGSPKLFHRAGFGASYLEEESLKELHDRERRSEGTLAKKRYLNRNTGENLSAKNAESQQGNSMVEGLLSGDLDKDASSDLQEGKQSSNVLSDSENDQKNQLAENDVSKNAKSVDTSNDKDISNDIQGDKSIIQSVLKNYKEADVGSTNPGAVSEELSNSNDCDKKDTLKDSQEDKVPSNVQSSLRNDQQPREAGNIATKDSGAFESRYVNKKNSEGLSSSNDQDTSNNVHEDKLVDHADFKNDQKNQVAENGVAENSDLSRPDSSPMERSSRIAEKGEDLVGNSLRTFGPASNGLQAARRSSASPSTEEEENVRASKTVEAVSAEGGGQAIKVLEPQGRLCEDCEHTKGVLGTDESGPGKLSQKPRKREGEGPGNINILLKSENKDLIQFSDCRGSGDDRPFVTNTLDVRKKLVVGKEPGKPDKTVSTVFNVKVEKALDDSAETKDYRKRDDATRISDGARLLDEASIFGFGKSKPNEDLFKDTFAFVNDKEASKPKESLINGDKGDSQTFYEDSPSSKTNVNTDESLQSKDISRDEPKSHEEQTEEDAKGKLTENAPFEPAPTDVGSSLTSNNFKQYEGSKKKTYHEVVIDPEGMADLKLNDAFGRRILQYMEYSNDDVENAELNYNDKEEEDNLRAGEAESSVQSQRRQRSASADKGKAKVNVLIQDKMKKKKTKRESVRKRRDPIKFIAYYDYDDDDVEQQVRDATGEQERVKTNSGLNAIDSNQGLETAAPPVKIDQQEKEMEKQWRRKQNMKNKKPVEYFQTDVDETKNKTITKESSDLSDMGTIVLDLERSRQQSGRTHKRRENKEMKLLDDVILEPIKYIMTIDERMVPVSMDNDLNDCQCMDPKSDKNQNVQPLYEEMKQLYDWNEDEVKIKPRIKGDQRLYHEPDDKEDPATNMIVEPVRDRAESPQNENRNSASDPSPNLLPLLAVQDKSSSTATLETSSPAESSQQQESSNVSRSNYFALKSTDDMFKGGSEQANSSSTTTEEKLRVAAGIGADGGGVGGVGGVGGGGGPRVQKVNGGRNDEEAGKKDAAVAGWSLTGDRQYIDTDSRSPYENRKYSMPPAAQFHREQVQNRDLAKQTVISPRDLHESFVDPSDWLDDLDEDMTVRLGRGLKTIQNFDSSSPDLTENSISPGNEIARTSSKTPKPETSEVGFVVDPASSQQSSGIRNNARVRRQADPRYDASEHQRNFDAADYNYSPEPEGDNRLQLSDSNTDVEYDYPEDKLDYNYYTKVVRSAKPKKGDKKKKKKVRGQKKKKKKKKAGKKKSSNRKRRHRNKHSEDSKAKDREKKHKKRVSKNLNHHTNVKKSKADHGEGKGHHQQSLHDQKRHRKEMAVVDNAKDQQKKVFVLLAADNMQDESQMDAAFHGDLAGKIVEQVFSQVHENEDLRASLGPGLDKNHKTEVAVATNKKYRQALDVNETKHTEELMKKVMQVLDTLMAEEVERKTCTPLPPDLSEFLGWMLDVKSGGSSQGQLTIVPLMHSVEPAMHFSQDRFLFQSGSGEEKEEASIKEMHKKLQLIEGLIKDYHALSETEKSKVRSVRNYLGKQVNSMLEYVNAKQRTETNWSSPTGIVHHQPEMRNASNSNRFDGPTRVSSASSVADTPKPAKKSTTRGRNALRDRRRVVRSVDKRPKPRKKHRAKGERERKHGRRHKAASAIDQPRHKDAGHKATATRQKRDYLDKDFWASFHQGYEAPVIYNSMDMIDAQPTHEIPQTLNHEDNTSKNGKSSEGLVEGLRDGDSKSSAKETATMKSSSVSARQISEAAVEEEPITGKNQVEDEVLLLNKRQSWKKENEEQLEEVAFGEDMRKGLLEKELFEKLTEIDKERSGTGTKSKDNGSSIEGNDLWGQHAADHTSKDCDTYLSDEEKLRALEEKINVYSDNDRDTRS